MLITNKILKIDILITLSPVSVSFIRGLTSFSFVTSQVYCNFANHINSKL